MGSEHKATADEILRLKEQTKKNINKEIKLIPPKKRVKRAARKMEEQLAERNYGLDFSILKTSDDAMARLRKILLEKNKTEMETFVVKGTAPIFGYPLLCYNEEGQHAGAEAVRAKILEEFSEDRAFLQVLMRHIFNNINNQPSID